MNWCRSLLKLCKRRGRVGADDADGGSDSLSTVSDADMSEGGWEDVSEPSTELRRAEAATSGPNLAKAAKSTPQSAEAETSTKQPDYFDQKGTPKAESDKGDAATPAPLEKQSKPPLKVTILEIGCGYNVPTCRVISERLACELSMRGGNATLVRINPSHPEPDDHAVEEFVISIMEKGLAALKMIQVEYESIKKESDEGRSSTSVK